MASNKQRGVLFDLDGVLIDSEGIYTTFWEAVDRHYPTGVENFAQVIKGSNLHKILHNYFPNDEIREQVSKMLDDFQQDMKYEYFDGAVGLVEMLKRANMRCCIVTSSDNHKMQSLYKQKPEFKDLFHAIVTGEMVANPKPSPECFLLGAEMLDLDIACCTVVEDSINGLKAGMASGARVIGLYTTVSEELIAPYCHMSAPCVASLKLENFL